MVGTFLEPSRGRRLKPIHSIPYSVAQPLERGSNNYYSIIQGEHPVAVRVVLDGLIVYQSSPQGTTAENGSWMDRKYATVLRSRASSLRIAVERELFGITEDWQRDEETHAFCGGAFPLIVNGEFCGAAIVSGLPHLEDHDLLVTVLKEDLNL